MKTIVQLIKAIIQGLIYALMLLAGITLGLAAIAGLVAWITGGVL